MQGGAKGITQTRVVLCGVVPEEPWEAVENGQGLAASRYTGLKPWC